jgi:hypothetical protein
VLVGSARGDARSLAARWRLACLACATILVLTIASLSPYMTSSTELVRMRNALLLKGQPTPDFGWPPSAPPADFMVERAPPSAHFKALVTALELPTLPSDWDRAVAVAKLLRVHPQSGSGEPIQSDLEDTYAKIVSTGRGYCGDYVRVYTALALAAGIPVRSWAFSFDGFGGHGHIFNEVWDASAGQWRMIDVFNNYYFVGPDGSALSALAFRKALESGASDVRMLPVEARSQPGFRFPAKAWDYYRRGLPEWYMWWGNDVYTYDQAPLLEVLGKVSRSLEELGGIAEGVSPKINVLQTDGNREAFARMERLRIHLLLALVIGTLSGLGVVVSGFAWWRASRSRPSPRTP